MEGRVGLTLKAKGKVKKKREEGGVARAQERERQREGCDKDWAKRENERRSDEEWVLLLLQLFVLCCFARKNKEEEEEEEERERKKRERKRTKQKKKKKTTTKTRGKTAAMPTKAHQFYSGVQWKKWAEFDVEIPLKAFIVAVWGMLLSEKGKCPHCRFVLPASIRPPAPNLSWGLHATFSWANHVPDLRSLSSLTAVPRKCTLSKKKRSIL